VNLNHSESMDDTPNFTENQKLLAIMSAIVYAGRCQMEVADKTGGYPDAAGCVEDAFDLMQRAHTFLATGTMR
jgi:hypothetical protein